MADKNNDDESSAADNKRSEESAKETAQSFSREARQPFASHKPTNSKAGVTFAHQQNLPKLPIPDLKETCQRYLEALEPLQTDREHADTAVAVREFLRSDGPELQEKLKKYATGKSSYIEQFWYDSYLNYDNPVVLNLNPFFLLEDDPTPARSNQVTRAASLVVSALAFVRAVRKEELPPDTIRKQPLCMFQYSRLFGTARIPTERGCQIAQDPSSKHIVVICRGQFYWFDVLDHNADLIMSEHDIVQNLETICADAEQTPVQDAARGAIGVLSTESRKTWSGLRDVISREEGSNNADCLNIVDSALYILCLDDSEPRTSADLAKNMLCGTSEVERGVQVGTCTNRWYDKLQIIVCKNGSAGINFEHTGVDGHTVLRFASDVYTDTILRFARSINGQAPSLWASSSPDPTKRDPASFGDVSTTPHKLEWDMTSELSTALRFAETRLADLIQQNEFETLEFTAYGKNFMTSMGFSPDAYVQMGFQAAYYGLYGRMECQYEPAMTKVYYHGRTEAIRPTTNESVDFVRTFWEDSAATDKVEALRKGCEKHVAITRRCAQAQGQDRHLYALLCVWQRSVSESEPEDSDDGVSPTSQSGGSSRAASSSSSSSPLRGSHSLPALFADSGWDKLNNTVLSTSNCGNPSLRHFGFGPTSGDGFGIGYIIKEGSISLCASSKHRQTKRFVEALEAYFLEMRKLLRQTRQVGVKDKSRSRAREREQADSQRGSRVRGKAIVHTPIDGGELVEEEEEDDDDLGGYGFFDAGMLLQAVRSSEQRRVGEQRPPNGSRRASEIAGNLAAAARKNVGKKLRLAEY